MHHAEWVLFAFVILAFLIWGGTRTFQVADTWWKPIYSFVRFAVVLGIGVFIGYWVLFVLVVGLLIGTGILGW